MSQIPEDIVQQFMQMTGLSRSEVEKMLSKSIAEMTNGPVFKNQTPGKKRKRGEKLKYDEENYPHYLPSDNVRKCTMRVALKDAPLPIWRKFECPSNITLRHLTELMLPLMGWWNEHLNQIEVPNGTVYVPCYQYSKDNDWGKTVFQEDYTIADILKVKGKSVKWEYDFGDSWIHELRLSSIDDYADDEIPGITFVSGKGECPPEDCGGVWGYKDLLELHAKRKSRKRLTAEEKERLEWFDIFKDYEPEFCDIDHCMDICDDFNEKTEDDGIIDITKQPSPKETGYEAEIEEELACMPPLYNDILSLAFKIRELEPWEDLDDSDIYAIRMLDGSEVYIATMGNGGESYDVQIFDGQESFQTYITMTESSKLPPFELMEVHSWANYTSIMFQEPDDNVMDPAQYQFIEVWAKRHGIEIADEHGYPFPQKYRAHYFPTMRLSDEELIRLKEVLEAVVWFSQEILDAESLTDLGFKPFREYPTMKGGKVVPLLIKAVNGYKVERTKLPGLTNKYETITLPESELQSLRFFEKKGAQYCRLIHAPKYIVDGFESYSPLIILCVDKKDEYLSMSKMSELTGAFEQDVLRQFVAKIKEEAKLPQRIITDNPRTEAFLRDFCQRLGIILEFKRTRIPQLTYVCQDMYDNLGKQ